MIISPEISNRDRLSAFIDAFGLAATVRFPAPPDAIGILAIRGSASGGPEQVTLDLGSGSDEQALVVAAVDFGGTHPLLEALPQHFTVTLDHEPVLAATIVAFVGEAMSTRCGRLASLNRLGEVIVLMIVRAAIDAGATGPGLLAGLAHPQLHRAIVAMHDDPGHSWRSEELAGLCGLSRSRFMALFPAVVGTTPAAYLTNWRLQLGRRALSHGSRVKAVARHRWASGVLLHSRALMPVALASPLVKP